MGRYKTTHTMEDVSALPLLPAMAKKVTITDTNTGAKAEGYDWDSYQKAEAKAWARLNRQQKQ